MNPHIAVLYQDIPNRTVDRLSGRARRIHNSPPRSKLAKSVWRLRRSPFTSSEAVRHRFQYHRRGFHPNDRDARADCHAAEEAVYTSADTGAKRATLEPSQAAPSPEWNAVLGSPHEDPSSGWVRQHHPFRSIREIGMGLIRKTLSVGTLGMVAFRSKTERLERADLARRRAQDALERADAARDDAVRRVATAEERAEHADAEAAKATRRLKRASKRGRRARNADRLARVVATAEPIVRSTLESAQTVSREAAERGLVRGRRARKAAKRAANEARKSAAHAADEAKRVAAQTAAEARKSAAQAKQTAAVAAAHSRKSATRSMLKAKEAASSAVSVVATDVDHLVSAASDALKEPRA
jgi:chemotaxis protein histidine kinase CheA